MDGVYGVKIYRTVSEFIEDTKFQGSSWQTVFELSAVQLRDSIELSGVQLTDCVQNVGSSTVDTLNQIHSDN
jgi:hypothetical protein